MTTPLDSYLATRRAQIDRTLDENLPPPETLPAILHQAMRYAVLGGGKRIRPILAIAAAEACGKTTHVVYGEAIAILVGDALLTEAFSWLARAGNVRAIQMLAEAIDSRGMIGGQVADLEGGSNLGQLEFIHRNKTAKLITAAVTLGGLIAKASEKQLAALQRYGEAAGLAFQIVDDLLDQEQTSAELGKTAGKDAAQGKLTYPALMGAAEARKRVEGLLKMAVENADMIGGPVNYLAPIARYICERRS